MLAHSRAIVNLRLSGQVNSRHLYLDSLAAILIDVRLLGNALDGNVLEGVEHVRIVDVGFPLGRKYHAQILFPELVNDVGVAGPPGGLQS